MTEPVNTEIADSLNAAMEPWQSPDLTEYNNAIGEMFRQIERLSDWEAVFDVDNCPDEALPYLAQFVGARVIVGSTPDQIRQQIRIPNRQARGTVAAIADATEALLTGTKRVMIRERDGVGATDNAWRLTVLVREDEAADLAAIKQAIAAVKPAGIVVTVQSYVGQDWESVRINYTTWADVKADNSTWGVVHTRPPGDPPA